MSEHQTLGGRQHPVELQKVLGSWLHLRRPSRTSIHVSARYEPADAQTLQAPETIAALNAHGRAPARFVAGQTGSSESGATSGGSIRSWRTTSPGQRIGEQVRRGARRPARPPTP